MRFDGIHNVVCVEVLRDMSILDIWSDVPSDGREAIDVLTALSQHGRTGRSSGTGDVRA